jgi:hypothetical protein
MVYKRDLPFFVQFTAVFILLYSSIFAQPQFVLETDPHKKHFRRPSGGASSYPIFFDFDKDGDEDLFTDGYASSRFGLYENVNGYFVEIENKYFGSTGGNVYARMAFGDCDGDGDIDVITSKNSDYKSSYNYWENDNDTFTSLLQHRFDDLLAGGNFSAPVFADIDNDGDLDIVNGVENGTLWVFENNNYVYSRLDQSLNPLNNIDAGDNAEPAFSDVDGDGDLDVVCGNNSGDLHFYRNDNGTYSEITGTENPFHAVDMTQYGGLSIPAFSDVDGDGDKDFICGNNKGNLIYCENTNNVFTELFGDENPLAGVEAEHGGAAPVVYDFDNDGDLDLLTGNQGGPLFYESPDTGNALNYFENRNGTYINLENNHPFANLYTGKLPFPTIADLDHDGDQDLICGTYRGDVFYYENQNGSYLEKTGNDNPFNGINKGTYSHPVLFDIDKDGDLDLILACWYSVFYFKNEGGMFVEQLGSDNPFDGIEHEYLTFEGIDFGDLDGDGDLDLILNIQTEGDLEYYENNQQVFTKLTGANDPFSTLEKYISGSHDGSIELVDLDNDNDLDLVVGNSWGYFLELINVAKNPTNNSTPVGTTAFLEIKPNPANNSIYTNTLGQYQIVNALGKVVKSGYSSFNGISISDLEEGIYILIYSNGMNTRFVKN